MTLNGSVCSAIAFSGLHRSRPRDLVSSTMFTDEYVCDSSTSLPTTDECLEWTFQQYVAAPPPSAESLTSFRQTDVELNSARVQRGHTQPDSDATLVSQDRCLCPVYTVTCRPVPILVVFLDFASSFCPWSTWSSSESRKRLYRQGTSFCQKSSAGVILTF